MKRDQLLQKFNCPVPYHGVRTLFLGAIATPRPVSPIETVKSIWGGQFPAVDSLADLNELLAWLMDSVWNDLIKHQKRSRPFKLVKLCPEPSRKQLANVARTRREEIEWFIEGLFGPLDDLDLPKRALEGLDHLGRLRGLFGGTERLLLDESKQTSEEELARLVTNLIEISNIAEKEIHAVVLACVSARRGGISSR